MIRLLLFLFLAFSVVFSIVFYIPRFFEYEWYWDGRQVPVLRFNVYYGYIYRIALYWLFIYVFPLSIILYTTTRLFQEVRKAR